MTKFTDQSSVGTNDVKLYVRSNPEGNVAFCVSYQQGAFMTEEYESAQSAYGAFKSGQLLKDLQEGIRNAISFNPKEKEHVQSNLEKLLEEFRSTHLSPTEKVYNQTTVQAKTRGLSDVTNAPASMVMA